MMAVVCALISGPLAFLFSLFWQIVTGGSVAGFFLTYFVSGQILFVTLLVFCYAADILRSRSCRGHDLQLPLDRPI